MQGREIRKVFQLENRKERDDLGHTGVDETIMLNRIVWL